MQRVSGFTCRREEAVLTRVHLNGRGDIVLRDVVAGKKVAGWIPAPLPESLPVPTVTVWVLSGDCSVFSEFKSNAHRPSPQNVHSEFIR